MRAKVLHADADRVSVVAIGGISDEADARVTLSNHGRGVLAQIVGGIGIEFHRLPERGLIVYEDREERDGDVRGSLIRLRHVLFLRQPEKESKQTDKPCS